MRAARIISSLSRLRVISTASLAGSLGIVLLSSSTDIAGVSIKQQSYLKAAKRLPVIPDGICPTFLIFVLQTYQNAL
jgi:hypothetical protein